MKNIIFALSLTFLLFSCQEKPVVIPEFNPVTSGRVVLVEELTGVGCSNCPTGAARLAAIQKDYPDNVVVVGIHGILLAEPLGTSKYDFRSQDAIDLETYLQPLAKPSAVVNRVRFDELGGNWGVLVSSQWQSFIEKELEKEQKINLSVKKEYDADTRELSVDVAALPLANLEGDYKVTVLLTESHIIDPQLDPSTIIEDYEHNHVLREIITDVKGDFFAKNMQKNKAEMKSYKFTLPSDSEGLWKPEHLEIVCFITNGSTEEVLQAVQKHVID